MPDQIGIRTERRMLIIKMFISLLILVIGSLETAGEVFCAREFETRVLTWPEKPTNSTYCVKSRVWYKDKKDLVAYWLQELGFVEGPNYKGRLMQVGDGGNMQIKTVTRSDSGNFMQISRFTDENNTSEASVYVQVIDAPARVCKPLISHEGSKLKAYLPSDDVCATSHLRLEWKDTNKTSTTQNGTTILDLGTDSVGEYMVCAVGEAAKCFQGNISDLCTSYTVSRHQQSGDGVILHPAVFAVPGIVLIALIVIGGVLIWLRYKGVICQKHSIEMDEEQKLEFPLIPLIPKSDLSKIRDHLKNCYRTMTDVLVYPVGKRNVSVKKVYVNLELEGIDTRDFEDTKTDLPSNFFEKDNVILMTQHKLFAPIMIVGDSGSGKSTWCKHIAYCWSHNSKMGDTEMEGLNLPPLINFQILLYLPLKHSDQRLSFQTLLQQSLFPTQQSYLKVVRNYMNEQNHSQSILIVIDGLDIIGRNASLKLISELLVSELLKSCTFIFTSQPSSFNQISDACTNKAMKLYKILEMSPEKSATYVNRVLNVINEQNNMKLSSDNFLTFAKYLHVECMLTSPYHCLSLLHVWMENKNPHIQMKDIVFNIIKHLLNHMIYYKSCEQNKCKLLQRIVDRYRLHHIKSFVDSVSIIADEKFQTKIKTMTGVDGLCHENLNISNIVQDARELGFISESPYLESKENISKLIFPNMLIDDFFVSKSVKLKKGPTFDYIMSSQDAALENSLIIHMLCQLSPTIGMEIFKTISKQKNRNIEKHNKPNIKYMIKHTRERHSATGKANREISIRWLENLLYRNQLDDKILLFVTDALKFTDSLSVLELKNLDNNKDLIFWLPFSKTLKKLILNISNCTLLLCPEWNYKEPINLTEVIIKSMFIHESTRCVLAKAVGTCKKLTTCKFPPSIRTNDINEILLPRSHHTSVS